MNVNSLFPEDNHENLLRQRLRAVTRENWIVRLAHEHCPACGTVGQFSSSYDANNNGIGLICVACQKPHPFRALGLQWLPKSDNVWKRGQS